MSAQTDTARPSSSVLRSVLAPRVGVRARIAFNVWRIVIGVILLASGRWIGPLAWIGLLPLGWAAVSFGWLYRRHHSVRA